MPYVVRDRRSTTRWAVGLVASVAVVLGVCAATDRWWVAVVGLPLSLVLAARRVQGETTPLRADGTGISLDGRWTGWDDVASVTVSPSSVRVRLGAHADLPSWARGRVVRDGLPDDGLQLAAAVRADQQALLEGIRAQAPQMVRVEMGR